MKTEEKSRNYFLGVNSILAWIGEIPYKYTNFNIKKCFGINLAFFFVVMANYFLAFVFFGFSSFLTIVYLYYKLLIHTYGSFRYHVFGKNILDHVTKEGVNVG